MQRSDPKIQRNLKDKSAAVSLFISKEKFAEYVTPEEKKSQAG